jgi:plasmid replication initiation protein
MGIVIKDESNVAVKRSQMFKKLIKDITGATAREKREKELAKEEKARQRRAAAKAKKAKAQAEESERLNKIKEAEEAIRNLSPKDRATLNNEPYINVLSLDVDVANIHQGSFELDWNDKFVANLVRAGYKAKDDDTDYDIVDRWFQNICRHVVLETWEQEQAINPSRVVKSRDLGDGYSEVS